MTSSVVEVKGGEPRLDEQRLYRAFNGLPVQPRGFNKQGDPIGQGGRILAQRESVKYFLQDGMLFDEAGALVPADRVPKLVQKQVDEMKANAPFPGITEPGRVLKCPAPGCPFRTTVENFYREHKRLHQEISPEQWMELEGTAGQKSVPYSLSDFADPKSALERGMPEAGTLPPRRESPQGED